jgi:Flp pilus assembly protein protease CpaA
MTRLEAHKIHAYHDACGRLTALFTLAVASLCLIAGFGFADLMAVTAACLAFFSIIASVSTDLSSKRIPNTLSLALLLSAPLWWAAGLMGSVTPGLEGAGVARQALGFIMPNGGSGSLLPALDLNAYAQIGMDIVMMIIVFIPLYLSFQFNLGFGGGDVKLITAGSLFLGWPLGLDFLVLSFLVGGTFSAGAILARSFARAAVKRGSTSQTAIGLSTFREFPFAPAIAIAAVICFSIKIEGIL